MEGGEERGRSGREGRGEGAKFTALVERTIVTAYKLIGPVKSRPQTPLQHCKRSGDETSAELIY